MISDDDYRFHPRDPADETWTETLFVIFSVIARGGRFFIVAILLNRYGTWIREAIEKRLGLWVIVATATLVLGFIIAFRLF